MIDLVEILNDYHKDQLEYFVESGIINALLLIREWDVMNDEDKVKKRIELLIYYKMHFNSTEREIKERKYEESVINLSKLIIKFLNKLDKCSNEIHRIGVMLYCELQSLNNNYSYRIINHVPFSILEDLKGKLTNLDEFNNHMLDELFSCYKEMYKLFLQKPYDVKE
ncbi:hypothetical protein [Myroides sp. N17-2]|uniref:hypothetical protein n=1 Tax=Myroides sp. N17-2 TaxID=2030799 RepID=UPI000EFDA579|nr:hypothetical protein [Myroides sp. N17-2]